MKSRFKKLLICFAVVSGILCLTAFVVRYCFSDFWDSQRHIYVLGLAEVCSDKFGYQLPDPDNIEVIALDGFAADSIPVADTALGHRVHGRAMLTGKDANKIANLWRYLRRGRGFSARCHSPAYVVRFHKGGKLLFETSICWECHNYTLPVGSFGRTYYGFDAERKDGQDLLELLQFHVPLPKKPSA